MLVVNRFRVSDPGSAQALQFQAQIELARNALAACQGHEFSEIGRSVDDPQLWVLASRWSNVGSYRRALSDYNVKLHAVPLLSQAIDEPSAFEVIGEAPLNVAQPRELG